MKDSHGRTIDYLRISLTDRCNFRCVYCMPEEGVCAMSHDEILRIEEIERLVAVAAGIGIRSVRLTGGEPLVRKGVVDLVDTITGIEGIENVSMTTNGVLLPRMIDDLKAAGLSRVNISLDTLDADQFHEITRTGRLEDTLAGIDAALGAGERVGDVSNVLFSNGWIADDDGTVYIYYASSDTRMHVAVSTVDRLVDYCLHTPADGLRSAASVAAVNALIDRNEAFLNG